MTHQCSRQARLFAIVASVAVCAATFSLPVHADPVQEANRLLRQGQYAQALEMIDRFLASKPKDAQARFLKGLILTEMNRQADAIIVFMRLTEDYPELPEPYNNLAVIYAQQKQYEKAKHALEMAIRTHPSYATAHENLGDIYARLASQAYDKALQLDSSNASAQTKLAMIRDLMSGSRVARAPAQPVKGSEVKLADARPAEPTRPESRMEATKTAEPVVPSAASAQQLNLAAKTPDKATATPATPTPSAVPASATEKSTEKVSPMGTASSAPTVSNAEKASTRPTESNSGTEISKAVEAWADAWSKKDVRAYLAHYARDFKPAGGESRSAWEAERSKRINKPGAIRVTIENLKVEMDGADRATVRFRQNYRSASLNSTTGKTLIMARRDGRWLIQQERVGG